MSLFLRLLADARDLLLFALTIVIFAAIAMTAPPIDESKLQTITGRVVKQISSDGLTLYVQPQGATEPTKLNVRNYRMPNKKRPDMISEIVEVRYKGSDDVIALTVNGEEYMTAAETIEKDRLSSQGTRQFVSISAPIVMTLLIGSLWARRKV